LGNELSFRSAAVAGQSTEELPGQRPEKLKELLQANCSVAMSETCWSWVFELGEQLARNPTAKGVAALEARWVLTHGTQASTLPLCSSEAVQAEERVEEEGGAEDEGDEAGEGEAEVEGGEEEMGEKKGER
jgi:hypothetical protein